MSQIFTTYLAHRLKELLHKCNILCEQLRHAARGGGIDHYYFTTLKQKKALNLESKKNK